MMAGGNVERNSIDRDGRTPLHLAAMGGTEEVLRSLLGDVADRGEDQNTYCIYRSQPEMSLIWPETAPCMAGDDDVLYGRRL